MASEAETQMLGEGGEVSESQEVGRKPNSRCAPKLEEDDDAGSSCPVDLG